MEAKLKHLEFIQGVVNRLASASFSIKRWAVVLVSALIFLLAGERASFEFAWAGFASVGIFWGLDGYFLWQERLFRALYDHVRNLDDQEIDFSMDARAFKRSWLDATFSRTLVPLYLVLAALVGAVAFID